MITKTFNIDFKQLQLKTSQIETVLGYKEGEDRSFVINLIDEILAESAAISNIKAQYEVFDDVGLDDLTKYLRIKNTYFQIKNIVFAQLKKTDSVAIFLCTAGAEIDTE